MVRFAGENHGRNRKLLRDFEEREREGPDCEREGGMGKLGNPRILDKCVFIWCLVTRRVSQTAAPARSRREARAGEGRPTCEAAPANTGDGFVSRYYSRHGSRGYSPTALHTTHMARPPSPPPLRPHPHRTDGEAFAAGRHFQKPAFAYEIYFCCRRAAAVLPSHVTRISAHEERGPRRRKKTGTFDLLWCL